MWKHSLGVDKVCRAHFGQKKNSTCPLCFYLLVLFCLANFFFPNNYNHLPSLFTATKYRQCHSRSYQGHPAGPKRQKHSSWSAVRDNKRLNHLGSCIVIQLTVICAQIHIWSFISTDGSSNSKRHKWKAKESLCRNLWSNECRWRGWKTFGTINGVYDITKLEKKGDKILLKKINK